MKDLKEENELKGKVIAIQQKLLEIAVQMFQEKKDECERLYKELDALSQENAFQKKEHEFYKVAFVNANIDKFQEDVKRIKLEEDKQT
jgi:hypothetical protein